MILEQNRRFPSILQRNLLDSDGTSAGSLVRGRESGDIYEWLRQLDANNAAPSMPVARRNVSATTDVPTWVGRMMGVAAEDIPEAPRAQKSVPEWLKHAPMTDDEPEALRPDEFLPSPATVEPELAQTPEYENVSPGQAAAEWLSQPAIEPILEPPVQHDAVAASEVVSEFVPGIRQRA